MPPLLLIALGLGAIVVVAGASKKTSGVSRCKAGLGKCKPPPKAPDKPHSDEPNGQQQQPAPTSTDDPNSGRAFTSFGVVNDYEPYERELLVLTVAVDPSRPEVGTGYVAVDVWVEGEGFQGGEVCSVRSWELDFDMGKMTKARVVASSADCPAGTQAMLKSTKGGKVGGAYGWVFLDMAWVVRPVDANSNAVYLRIRAPKQTFTTTEQNYGGFAPEDADFVGVHVDAMWRFVVPGAGE